MKSKSLRITGFIFIGFLIYYLLFLNFKSIKLKLDVLTNQGLISYILTYFLIGIPLFLVTYFINDKNSIFKSLDLSKSFFKGMVLGLFFASPMLLGGYFFFSIHPNVNYQNLIAGTLIAGLVEEIYYRGFFFGQFFKKTKIGFIPAILIGSMIFAFGHLYQSLIVEEMIMIFMLTFFASIFFAWLYVEWNYNLWVPIFLHIFMNLSWGIFAMDENALGGTKANVFRALTIFIAIVFTLIYKRKTKQKLEITKENLILKV